MDNTLTNLVRNVRSLSKHVDNIVGNDKIINIIVFKETQIILTDSTCKIIETLIFFNINFHSNENKYLRLAYGCRNNVAFSDKFDANEVLIFSFEKHVFADRVFTIMLVSRKQSLGMQEFSQLMQY